MNVLRLSDDLALIPIESDYGSYNMEYYIKLSTYKYKLAEENKVK